MQPAAAADDSGAAGAGEAEALWWCVIAVGEVSVLDEPELGYEKLPFPRSCQGMRATVSNILSDD